MKTKDLISIKDLTLKEINDLFTLTDELKKDRQKFSTRLKGKCLGLIFQKPSTRTRVSFEVGIISLGGQGIYLGPDDIKLGVREKTCDIARVLSRYLDAIIARTFSHQDILELAKYAAVPVINGLSDLLHPCQGLSDIYTIKEKKGRLKGINLAFVGDGNNVLHSLLYAAGKTGINLAIATPKGYEPDKRIVAEAKLMAEKQGAVISLCNDPDKTVKGADFIYTDVWTSMGQEKEREQRLKAFKDFQINSKLLAIAGKGCLVMHCLPAHRGEEITDKVLDGPQSIVFDQAENRMHVQKAVLLILLSDKL